MSKRECNSITKNSDVMLCEQIVKEIQKYIFSELSQHVIIRILYFDDLGFYPCVWFTSKEEYTADEVKKLLKRDFECLDFDRKYNSKDLVISIESKDINSEHIAYEYEDDCFKDIEELFDEICSQISSVLSVYVSKNTNDNENVKRLRTEISVMKNAIAKTIFGGE